MDGKRIGRVDAPSQFWFDNIEPPTRLRRRKERGSFLQQVRRRGSIFKKKQFWLDNLETTPKLRSRVDRGSTSFLEQVKRRGSEAIVKVKEVGVIWGGSLVLQTVIGPGIFTSPKGVIQFGGSIGLSYVIWTWSGLISMLAALCFVELQLSVPRAGCEYGYIHKAFGRIPTFIYTWMRIALAEPVTTAVFTIAFADYVADTIFDNCGPAEILRKLVAVVAAVSLTVMNGIFRKLSKGLNVLANIGKFVTLSIVILCGLYNLCKGKTAVLQQGFQHTETEYDSIVIAIYNSLWAYGGWANVPHVTAGVRRPPRNLPLLILTVIPFVTCVYLLTVTSFFTVLSRQEMMSAEAIGVLWGQKMWGPIGYIIPVFVAFIALGNANGTFLSAGRTASVAVHDGYIPELLSYVHVKTKIHVPAVAARCVGTIVLIFITDVGSLLRFYVFTVWLFHGVTMLGLLVMRWKKNNYYKPYKVPIFVPVIVFLFSLTIVIVPFTAGVPRKEFLFSVVVAALSIIGFLPFGKAKRFMKYLDWFVVLVQLLMNVIPPKIQKHKQSRSLRPTRKFTPASMKLTDTLYTPGRFSSTSVSSLEDADISPLRRVRFAFPNDLLTDEDRKISTISNYSNASSDYCEVMTDYDDAHGENDSLTDSNNSTDSAQSASSVEEHGKDTAKNTDIEMDDIVKPPSHTMHRSVSVNSTTPLLVSTVLTEKL